MPSPAVSPKIDAVAAAEDAGLRAVLTTGRDYNLAIGIWRQLRLKRPPQPIVLISGAMVSEAQTGRTLYQKTISRGLACEFADALCERGRSAMAFVDPWRHDVEYFIAVLIA